MGRHRETDPDRRSELLTMAGFIVISVFAVVMSVYYLRGR